MPLTVFTAGHSSPQGVFYPDVTAPVVALPHRQAAELLRLLRVIDPHLVRIPDTPSFARSISPHGSVTRSR